jgi:beta-phosphoglucomutase
MIKGFVFDLDGVITDTAKYHFQAWKEMAAKELNIVVTPELNEHLKGVSRMDSLDVILRAGGKEQDYTREQKVALATEKNDLYKKLISHMTAADILPGINDFLTDLQQNDYPISVASASFNAPVIIERLGLSYILDKIVDPGTLHHGKPDPEIFEKAADLIGTPYAETVGLEDATAGIAGIKAAGMFAVGIGPKSQLPAADINFDQTGDISLTAIERAFDRIHH